MTTLATLPTCQAVLADVARCEQGDGWLLECEQAGRYVALTGELVSALATCLRRLGESPALEICAGDGALAAALGDAGVLLRATDIAPAAGHVEALDAITALRRYRPRVVLGSFVPFDAGIERAVLSEACVQHYIALNARLGGAFGDPALWRQTGWTATRLPDLERWMITRHDVWVAENRPLLTRGEAWLFQRNSG